MKLNHPRLVDSLRKAYSAEMAASYAYIGHASSLADPVERAAVRQIEQDEWTHRRNIRKIMDRYGILVSKCYEAKYYVIGKFIGLSCHVIGRFMPYFFAGKLESGNVCEYFVMIRHFHELGVKDHDPILYEMGIKEKEHEVHFLDVIRGEPWLPYFEKVFSWGAKTSRNDVDLGRPLPVEAGGSYCRNHPKPGVPPSSP